MELYNLKMAEHYDKLIDENNDPVHDPAPLREYMDKWDGEDFIKELSLSGNMSVLEIGVGTGRLAIRTCGSCRSLTGIDISFKTIERAKENLKNFRNIWLIWGDFIEYDFDVKFDVIYSSLTFLHIREKKEAIRKISGLLGPAGRFVLSVCKETGSFLEYNDRKIMVFPDDPDIIAQHMEECGLRLLSRNETEFAYIITAEKG